MTVKLLFYIFMIRMGIKCQIIDLHIFLIKGMGQSIGILTDPLHAKPQGIRSYMGEKRIHGGHAASQIFPDIRPQPYGKSSLSIFFEIIKSTVLFKIPFIFSAVHYDAAYGIAASVYILRGGMYHYVGAKRQGLYYIRRGRRGIHYKGNTGLMRSIRSLPYVQHIQRRIADHFPEHCSGPFVCKSRDGLFVQNVRKPGNDAQLLQIM